MPNQMFEWVEPRQCFCTQTPLATALGVSQLSQANITCDHPCLNHVLLNVTLFIKIIHLLKVARNLIHISYQKKNGLLL